MWHKLWQNHGRSNICHLSRSEIPSCHVMQRQWATRDLLHHVQVATMMCILSVGHVGDLGLLTMDSVLGGLGYRDLTLGTSIVPFEGYKHKLCLMGTLHRVKASQFIEWPISCKLKQILTTYIIPQWSHSVSDHIITLISTWVSSYVLLLICLNNLLNSQSANPVVDKHQHSLSLLRVC